jgi:hypothetical protein
MVCHGVGGPGQKKYLLSEENAQLQQAVASHAVIDQVIGALVTVWQVQPHVGWEVMREVSQSLNINSTPWQARSSTGR